MTTLPARAASTVIGDVGQRPVRAFRVLAIDPGPVESAYVVFDGRAVIHAAKLGNNELLAQLVLAHSDGAGPCIVERVASFGMPVGEEVFETVHWAGRFAQKWYDLGVAARSTMLVGAVHRIKRHDIKLHLCKSARANDSTIRQALIDRFGGKERAIGKKKTPGPLYGIHGDCWSALAVAVTWWDQNVGAKSNTSEARIVCHQLTET